MLCHESQNRCVFFSWFPTPPPPLLHLSTSCHPSENPSLFFGEKFWIMVRLSNFHQPFCWVGEIISGNVYNPFRFSNVSYFSYTCNLKDHLHRSIWRHGGLTVSALDLGLSALGSNHSWVHCVVFLSKTLYSHSACLHSGV